MATIPEALAVAIEHHRGGRLEAAERIYRQILQADPTQADATHLLGVIAHQVGRNALAAEYIVRAIALRPNAAEFHSNLANVYYALGRIPEATACARRALELAPDSAEAHNNLGNALEEQGMQEEAAACFRRALALDPACTEAHSNLGNILKEQGKLDEAIGCYCRALELKADFAPAHFNLGDALMQQGRLDEAMERYRRALELNPAFAEAHNNLGAALKERGRWGEAAACYRRAVELKPTFAEAHNNLGNALKEQWQLDDAIACYRRALELNPGLAETHRNLGRVFKEQGKLAEAIACYRRALALSPGLAEAVNDLGVAFKEQGRLDEAIDWFRRAIALEPKNDAMHSNLITAMQYHPGYDAALIHEEQRRWHRQFEEPLRGLRRPHLNERDPDRRLRIGYVSPDFCSHVVGRNVLPVLERHDHSRFQVFCYASVAQPDGLTQRFQNCADVWRDITYASDQAVADLVRADQIDILVDLSLHTAGHRLNVFGRKPAPVQVSWAGYPGTTGLEAIEYHITDPHLEPPSTVDGPTAEMPIRLPDSFWCYASLTESPPVNPSPALVNGGVTFGSLNNYCKVNEAVIALWSQLLGAVKGSRLILLSREGSHREGALEVFARCGVTADRIDWFAPAARPEYLVAYHRIDLGLDTFPYNGHTTSLDSAWMGVPVVTLVGSTVVGRAGLSQLMNLGLPELIAYSHEEFVRIAVDLAQDLPRLNLLRATLRDRMEASPIMDLAGFTGKMEAACRQMWQRWCIS